LYYIAENLDRRFEEFATRISNMTGVDIEAGRLEVSQSIERLFYWAAYSDKYGGEVKETPVYGAVVSVHEPVGVIGIACPDENPLLSFVSALGPAIVRGNVVVIIPSEKYPLAATDLYQVFETSDVPPGVVNIISGGRDLLTKVCTKILDFVELILG
jgi:aldehyde dehydrogenase (NAD+)